MFTTVLVCLLAAPSGSAPSLPVHIDPLITPHAVTAQPDVEFVSPLDGATVPYGPLVVRIAATPGSGARLVNGSLTGITDPNARWSYPTADSPHAVEVTSLNPGTQTLRVQVSDSAGRTATQSVSITVRTPAIDTQAPVVAITAPTQDPITLVSGRPLTLSGTASDDVALQAVTWRMSGQSTGSGRLSAMGTWSQTFAPLPAGTYTFNVTATDRSGRQATRTRVIQVAQDPTTPPPGSPAANPEKGGDIVNGCGAGSGLSALLLLFAPLAALLGRRRIE